jgi:hypothetical protein
MAFSAHIVSQINQSIAVILAMLFRLRASCMSSRPHQKFHPGGNRHVPLDGYIKLSTPSGDHSFFPLNYSYTIFLHLLSTWNISLSLFNSEPLDI